MNINKDITNISLKEWHSLMQQLHLEELQKRGNLSVNNLDRILQELERRGCMKPVEKSGPFGKSIQLKITEKGVREFRRM